MTMPTISDLALGKLRAAKASVLDHAETRGIMEAKDQVYARYHPPFQPGAINSIDEEVLRSFLYFENNRHWSGLARQVNRVTSNMATTSLALTDLVDESLPLTKRMEPILAIKGMGKGIITAILHVAYPGQYGVWNNTSHEGLETLGLMPELPRGAKFGERYAAINQVLVALAQALEVDLWTLDTLWWLLETKPTEDDDDVIEPSLAITAAIPALAPVGRVPRFALERHLHDYMFDNWDVLGLAVDWAIYARDGEPDAGYEFRTPVGRIDLLARHKRDGSWLVIELKREKSSDAVVGQLLRYMGWVQKHLVENGEPVSGLIVATEGDPQLHYALEVMPSVSFKSYEVEFRLKDGPSFEEFAKP